MVFLFFLIFYVIIGTSESVSQTSGFYSGNLNNFINKFEIVYPERVSKDGTFESHYIPQYYNMESRPRRDSGHDPSSDKDEIHFFIPINGKQLHLKLWPSSNFLAPGLVVEKRDANNINDAKISQISQKHQCHYTGEVVGEPHSNVALSTCYGLTGYIRTPDAEYLIEPVKDSKPTSEKEHPHIIYKRSDIKDKSSGSNCLTKGSAKEALRERMRWEEIYGHQVHNEMSGINFNEIVRENVKTSADLSSPKVDSLNKNIPKEETVLNDIDKSQVNDYPNSKFVQHNSLHQTNTANKEDIVDSRKMLENDKTVISSNFVSPKNNKKKLKRGDKYLVKKLNGNVRNDQAEAVKEFLSKENSKLTDTQEATFKDKDLNNDKNIKEPETHKNLESIDKFGKLRKNIQRTVLDANNNNEELVRSNQQESYFRSEDKAFQKTNSAGLISKKNSGNLTNQGSNDATLVNAKIKNLDRRQVWPDDCDVPTTSEENLLCYDFFNKAFNLELMVTVDYKVVKMHEEDDIENFILTIINMVSSNFYDKSININLSVFLVRLILLTTCIKELDSDRFNPEELLENFCTWQVLINPGKDDHPHHHDLAVFVTRMDKCEGQVMGVTYMTSVCRPDKACIVCVDEGLLLANTITHQIGHALGAEHDESEGYGCTGETPDGKSYHMAPKITETSSSWSLCSSDAITQFVKTQGSWCLADYPIEKQFSFPLILPGQIYSAAQQCKLNFHMNSYPCLIGPFCKKLYCQVTEKYCATKGDPPADGTFCASDMWCFRKECVHIGRRPGAVNGEWGLWTEWTLCTRSCGGGVATSYRICNNPKPENGGRYCVGPRIRHKMCYTKPCQGFTESFRDLQCKKTEDKPFRGRLHNWSQYHSFFLNIECSLICKNRRGEVVMRSPVVADGTPCKAGTRNVCIQGVCRNVGCDWVIDSNAKEDACGVCQGNGTECRIVQGSFDELSTGKGLMEFLRIPKDSGMIFVREISPSANTIVVSGAVNHIFYLNGKGTADTMPGDITLGQAHGVYEERSGMERIFIRGPTTEELVFYVQFQEQNTGIHYQYAVAEVDPNYVPRYLWQYIDWDPCTDPCSGGSQRSHAKCVEDRGGVVDDMYCKESSRPQDIIRPCNDFPCHAKWWVSVWSDCICTATENVMFRSVLCLRATDESGTRSEVVRESECYAHKKPSTQKPCNVTDDEDACLAKRSVLQDPTFRSQMYRKRSINASTSSQPESSNELQNSQLQVQIIPNTNTDKEQEKFGIVENQQDNFQAQANNKDANTKKTEDGSLQLKGMIESSNLENKSPNLEKPDAALKSNLAEYSSITKDPLLDMIKDNQEVKLDSLIHDSKKAKLSEMKIKDNQEVKLDSLIHDSKNAKLSETKIKDNQEVKLDSLIQDSKNAKLSKTKIKDNQEVKLDSLIHESKNAKLSETKIKDSQEVKLNSLIHDSKNAKLSETKNVYKGKETKDLVSDNSNFESDCEAEDKCKTQATCPPLPPECSEPITCRQTCPVQPHPKTICCKGIPKLPCTKEPETTTLRPLVMETDQLNINNFALTVVPLDNPKGKKLPQTDPEFINLGNLGQYNVGDEANGTIITGQDALDLLEYARKSNSSQ